MDEYQVLLLYSGFAITLFVLGMIWVHHKDALKRRFALLNYGPADENKGAANPA